MFVFANDEYNSMIDLIAEGLLDTDIDDTMWLGKYGLFVVSKDINKCKIYVKGPKLNKSFGCLRTIRGVFY